MFGAKNVLPPSVRKALANDSCFPSEMGSIVFFIWAHVPTREDICKKVKEKAIPASLVSLRLVSPCFLLRKKKYERKGKTKTSKTSAIM